MRRSRAARPARRPAGRCARAPTRCRGRAPIRWSRRTVERREQVAHARRERGVARRRVSNACSAGGKPPKSWIVCGCAIAVTAVPRMYQCAEMARIAFGLPKRAPAAAHASVCAVALERVHRAAVPEEHGRLRVRLGVDVRYLEHDVPDDRYRVRLHRRRAIARSGPWRRGDRRVRDSGRGSRARCIASPSKNICVVRRVPRAGDVEVNVRRAPGIGRRLDRLDPVIAVGIGHELAVALEIGIERSRRVGVARDGGSGRTRWPATARARARRCGLPLVSTTRPVTYRIVPCGALRVSRRPA